MQLKEFSLILDIKKHIKQDYIEVVQGDSYSNIFNLTLMDGLNPFSLTDTTVEIVFRKSDGTTVLQNDIIVSDASQGKMQCTLKTNTIASQGNTVAEVRVLEGDTLLTSTKFDFFVRNSLINDETIESTNEFPVLTQLISTAEGLIEQIGLIEKQVPEQVVTDLNAVSTLAAQLQTEVNEHKAESASDAIRPHGMGSVASKDYAEGIWTPTIRGKTVAGDNTYSRQEGHYKRIGNLVWLTCDIVMTAKDVAMAGGITIGGIPFITSKKETGSIYYANLGTTAGQVPAAISNLSGIDLFWLSLGNAAAIAAADVKANTNVRVTMVYSL